MHLCHAQAETEMLLDQAEEFLAHCRLEGGVAFTFPSRIFVALSKNCAAGGQCPVLSCSAVQTYYMTREREEYGWFQQKTLKRNKLTSLVIELRTRQSTLIRTPNRGHTCCRGKQGTGKTPLKYSMLYVPISKEVLKGMKLLFPSGDGG